MSYRLGSTRRTTGEQSVKAGAERSIAVRAKVAPKKIKYLYVRQGISDMPADGDDFSKTVLQDLNCKIPMVTIRASAGTYTVQLKYDGSVVAEDLTETTTYPYYFTSPVSYTGNKFITVHVEESVDVEDFEAVFTLVKI